MLHVPDKRLALQAYEQVLDLIMSGQARPGDLINERRLADTLNMSRTPVRDALLMLEGEGLLVRQGMRGLQIKHMKVEDFMDALQIRQLLEPEVARIAAGRVPDAALDDLAAQLEALIRDASVGTAIVERAQVRSIDDKLHGLIADASGNPQLSAMIRTLRRQTQIFDLKSLPERLQDTCGEHLVIVRAIRAGEGDKACEAMKLHLERVRDSIIARLARM